MKQKKQSVAEKIRLRIEGSKGSFLANDNISKFLLDGEIEALQAEVELAAADLLRALVIDTDNDHNTKDTAKRVAKMMMLEVFSGRYEPMPRMTDFPNTKMHPLGFPILPRCQNFTIFGVLPWTSNQLATFLRSPN